MEFNKIVNIDKRKLNILFCKCVLFSMDIDRDM